MVKQFLKIAGARNEKEFLSMFPNEESFFSAYPEAEMLVNANNQMAYGGSPMYQYGPGGPILPGTLKTAVNQMREAEAQPVVGADGTTSFIRRPADQMDNFVGPIQPPQYAQAPKPAAPKYEGVSIVDMLSSQGMASDFATRKAMAKDMGISGYKGTAAQNRQLMEMMGGKFNGSINEQAPQRTVKKTSVPDSGKKTAAPQEPVKNISEKDARIAERKAAKDFSDGKTDKFKLPNGKTKTYDQMTWKEKAYVSGKSLEGKGRFNENDEAWYDNINPLNWITSAAGALGEAPLQAEMSGSMKPIASAIGTPLAAGAGVGLLKGAYDYFKPRYEPYFPKGLPAGKQQKGLPGSTSSSNSTSTTSTAATPKQLPGSPSTKQLPAPAIVKRISGYPTPKGLPDPRMRLLPKVKNEYGGEQMAYGGGMYAHGGQSFNPGVYEDGYSGTSSAGNYFPDGGTFIPQPMMMPGQLPEYGYGRAMYGAGMAYGGNIPDGRALINAYAQGGSYSKGSVHDMDESQIQELINQGYKIEYV